MLHWLYTREFLENSKQVIVYLFLFVLAVENSTTKCAKDCSLLSRTNSCSFGAQQPPKSGLNRPKILIWFQELQILANTVSTIVSLVIYAHSLLYFSIETEKVVLPMFYKTRSVTKAMPLSEIFGLSTFPVFWVSRYFDVRKYFENVMSFQITELPKILPIILTENFISAKNSEHNYVHYVTARSPENNYVSY